MDPYSIVSGVIGTLSDGNSISTPTSKLSTETAWRKQYVLALGKVA